MCGIFGFLTPDERLLPSSSVLDEVVRDLQHRGPDASSHVSFGKIALAHTRLALLDLRERANQPMWHESRRHCLLYNGEVYNFRYLRADLQQAGYRFETESDTEVVLYGLLHQGTRFLDRMEGMFAFALYDSTTHRLLLARDRFGIKPLVYASTEDFFCFASEARALRSCLPSLPNRYGVAAYLTGLEPPTQGATLFQRLKSLKSGHYLQVGLTGVVKSQAFFSIPQFARSGLAAELKIARPGDLVQRLDSLVHDSVRKHLIADVDVGCLCSGGLDSSLIAAVAARYNPNIVLFHADVVGRKSERKAAERLAGHLGLDLLSVPVDDQRFLSLIPETVLHYEAPFSYHPNSVPFLAVAKLVREHGIKAILSGEGADESFLGYAATRREVAAMRFGKPLRWLGGLALKRLRTNAPARGTDRRDLGGPILGPLERQSDGRAIAEFDGAEPVDRTCLQLLGYHLRTLMHRNDRLGMASSIEARFPYLDHELVAFAANLPVRHKVRITLRYLVRNRHPITVKWLLRRVGEGYLPADLAYRRKRGFPTTGLRRLRVDTAYFRKSWIRNELALSKPELDILCEEASPSFLSRLALADLWGRLLIVNLPTKRRLARVLNAEPQAYSSLLGRIEEDHELIDPTRELLEVAKTSSFDSIFGGYHYSASGNRIVAGVISRFIVAQEPVLRP